MATVKIVDGTYAGVIGEEVVAVVSRYSDQWAFKPLYPGNEASTSPIPLPAALEMLVRYVPDHCRSG